MSARFILARLDVRQRAGNLGAPQRPGKHHERQRNQDRPRKSAGPQSKARVRFHPAPASSAARIPSSEYVTGINRARNRNGPGSTLTGYIIPPTRLETPKHQPLRGISALKENRITRR